MKQRDLLIIAASAIGTFLILKYVIKKPFKELPKVIPQGTDKSNPEDELKILNTNELNPTLVKYL